jgi:hypothetical protein
MADGGLVACLLEISSRWPLVLPAHCPLLIGELPLSRNAVFFRLLLHRQPFVG